MAYIAGFQNKSVFLAKSNLSGKIACCTSAD